MFTSFIDAKILHTINGTNQELSFFDKQIQWMGNKNPDVQTTNSCGVGHNCTLFFLNFVIHRYFLKVLVNDPDDQMRLINLEFAVKSSEAIKYDGKFPLLDTSKFKNLAVSHPFHEPNKQSLGATQVISFDLF